MFEDYFVLFAGLFRQIQVKLFGFQIQINCRFKGFDRVSLLFRVSQGFPLDEFFFASVKFRSAFCTSSIQPTDGFPSFLKTKKTFG